MNIKERIQMLIVNALDKSDINVEINGISVNGSKSISISNNKVIIDGIEVPKSEQDEFNIDNCKVVDVKIIGDTGSIDCNGSVTITGNVFGSVNCGTYSNIGGNVTSYVDAGNSITIKGDCQSDINASNSVTIEGNSNGDIDAGGSITIRGNHTGGCIDAGGNVKIG